MQGVQISESKQAPHGFRLIVTAALEAELPVKFLKQHDVKIATIRGLKSGVLNMPLSSRRNRGVLFVITGVGRDAAIASAHWIAANLFPFAVLNIGTAGVPRNFPELFQPGMPVMINSVSDSDSNSTIMLPDRLPFSLPKHFTKPPSAPLKTLPCPASEQKGIQHASSSLVDMEAFFMAECFARAGIPFHALKFMSDRLDGQHGEYFSNLDAVRYKIEELFEFLTWSLTPPDFSVIIPVCNRKRRVCRAIDSVIGQKYKASEIIVVDDGSTDGTYQALTGYGNKIRLISLPENRGVSAARNVGVSEARNGWIAFLDSDDLWKPEKLQNDASFIRENPFYAIFQSDEIWIRNGQRVNRCRHHIKPEGWIFEKCIERCMITPSAVILRKRLFDIYGMFDESLPACEDYELWLRISRNMPIGLNPDKTVVKYGGANDQLSCRFPAMDRFRVFALTRALKNEPVKKIRDMIASSIKFRLEILLKGALKRNLDKEIEVYRDMLQELINDDITEISLKAPWLISD